MDSLELLACMQALCIYILIRLDEGETEHNNFDSLMVKTVIVSPALQTLLIIYLNIFVR